MGNLYIGTKHPTSVYVGTHKVKSIYIDVNNVWRAETAQDLCPIDIVDSGYLCFTALTSNSTIEMHSIPETVFEISTNQYSWTQFIPGETVVKLKHEGDKVYFRGNNYTLSTEDADTTFMMSGSIAASGNIMSLLDITNKSTTIYSDYCFKGLFYNCTCLITAPTLSATTLTPHCYERMFEGCTSLLTASKLPAQTMKDYCYAEMFALCSTITKPPVLPGTVLGVGCYKDMFNGCTKLVTLPRLPGNPVEGCYENMFYGCNLIHVSETRSDEYSKQWRVPIVGTGTVAEDWNLNMLNSTGGPFVGKDTDYGPEINKVYFTNNQPVE